MRRLSRVSVIGVMNAHGGQVVGVLGNFGIVIARSVNDWVSVAMTRWTRSSPRQRSSMCMCHETNSDSHGMNLQGRL